MEGAGLGTRLLPDTRARAMVREYRP